MPPSQPSRWFILALLFLVRCCMGFQFQAVPAVSPLYLSGFGVTAADIGLLIGLYHAPGMALAIPGGGFGARYGDKPVVAAGLVLMLLGGIVMATSGPTSNATSGLWSMQLLGRVVAGTGGVLLNVAMSKMVADWFAGREIATAMGIFVNSWPVGVALGLLVHPMLAAHGGLLLVHTAVAAAIVAGLVALIALYPVPVAAVAGSAGSKGTWPRGIALAAVLTAGLVWGLYNAAIGVVFGFGPLALVERGMSLAAASGLISIVLWSVSLSVAAGGLVADRMRRPISVLSFSFAGFAAALVATLRTDALVPALVIMALVGGLAAGPIMSLPSRVLVPQTRSLGMGLFFTVFYAMQLIGPWLSGRIAASRGTAAVTFDVGALMLVVGLLATALFLVLAGRVKRD